MQMKSRGESRKAQKSQIKFEERWVHPFKAKIGIIVA